MSQTSAQKERQQLAAAIGGNSQGGSSWRQQPGKQSKPATPLLVFSPGIGKRRKLGAATRSGLGIAGGGQKFPGRREWQGAAGSSLALGAARDMPSRACLHRKRGKQGAAGRVAEASRGGGNTSSRIFQHMSPHLVWLAILLEPCKRPTNPQPTFLVRNV